MSYQQKAQGLTSRLSPRLGADVHDDVRLALGIATTVREKVSGILADKRFSPEGHCEQIKKMLGKGPLDHLDQIRAKFRKPLASLNEERAKYVLEFDRADTFGELQRQEVRAWLRSLPASERLRQAAETKDPLIREAIAFAPLPLSGVNAEVKQAVCDGLLVERFGDKIAKNAELLEGYEYALAVVEEAGRDIRREANISEQEFAALRPAA